MENTFVVIGGKWFDKINGNTYHSAKIIDQNGNKYYTRFCYGYGSQYITSAKEYIETTLGLSAYKIIDGGSFYMNKKEVKNGWF